MQSQDDHTPQTYEQWLASMHGGAHARRTAERHAAFFLPHLRPGMALLDAGCGPGSITIGLAAAIASDDARGTATGVDANAESIEGAAALAADRGVTNVRFQAADVHALPFADATFDAAFMHAVLQHLLDPLVALIEVRRVMRPGAVIGIADADLTYGHMIYPSSAGLERAMDLTVRLRQASGGTADAGRRLGALLAYAGFARIEATVTAECTGTAGATRATGAFQASYLTAEPFSAHVTSLGLSTPSELADMAEAWRTWGETPGAMWVRLWCYAVGFA